MFRPSRRTRTSRLLIFTPREAGRVRKIEGHALALRASATLDWRGCSRQRSRILISGLVGLVREVADFPRTLIFKGEMMTDKYWPDDWQLRHKAEWYARWYQVKARRFVRRHQRLLFVMAIAALAASVVMFFLP